jgi:hypothetical protein
MKACISDLNVVKKVTIAANRDVLHLRFVEHNYEKRKVCESLSIALQSNFRLFATMKRTSRY